MKLTYEETMIWDSPAVNFAPDLIECVRVGAEKAGFTIARHGLRRRPRCRLYRPRRADHDDFRALRRRHFSHNEAESTSFDECAAGAQVLLNAVLEYDRRLG